jgi:membrane protease YdiL (CAAX protease family)
MLPAKGPLNRHQTPAQRLSNMNLVVLVIVSAGGIYYITRAIKDLKVKGSRVWALWVIMASCAFILALGILAKMRLSPGLLTRVVSDLQRIDVGIWIGIFLAMCINGNFVRNKNETETSRSQQ